VTDVVHISGGCHCGAVRFQATAPAAPEVLDCNCSICAKTGHLHLIVPHVDFELLSGADHLTSYRFNSGAAEHLFCQVCGVKSFYQPRSHPAAWSVNLRCLDAGHDLKPHIRAFDGQNWEAAKSALGDAA
jgi:hypothetical protein